MTRLLTVVAVTLAALIALGGLAAIAQEVLSREETRTERIPGAVRAVVVQAEDGDVRIRGGGGPTTVRREEEWLARRPEIRESLRDGVLRIDARCRDLPLLGSCRTELDIVTGADIDVRVTADAGDVAVADVRGAVAAQTDAGDVEAQGVVGPARLRTDAGDVEVGALRADRVRADSDAGDVELDLLTVPVAVEASTDAGDVTVRLPRAAYAIDTETDAGDTDVRGLVVEDRAPRRVRVSTDAGDVTVWAR